MGPIEKLDALERKFWELINGRTERFVEEVADTKRELMADLNRAQLNEGIDSRGRRIEPPYTPRTVKIKTIKGQPTNKVMLLDTGRFQSLIKAQKHNKAYYMESSDDKTEKLVNKYGEDIEGLTDENKDLVAASMKEPLIEKHRNFFEI